jgi:hypothetical protein
MKKLIFLVAFILGSVAVVQADAVEDKIRGTIQEIVRLGSQPTPSAEDQKKMLGLYNEMQGYGMNAVPVLEQILKAKGNLIEKKAALYSVQFVYQPKNAEDVAFKVEQAMKLYNLAAKDSEPDMRLFAIEFLAATNSSDSFGSLRDIYEQDTDLRVRLTALNKIGFFQTDSAAALISKAAADTNPTIQTYAMQLQASRSEMIAKYEAQQAANPKPVAGTVKHTGKNA